MFTLHALELLWLMKLILARPDMKYILLSLLFLHVGLYRGMIFICITAYMMFGLPGDTDIHFLSIEIILATSLLSFTVAVAVSAIIFTLGGKRCKSVVASDYTYLMD